MAASINQIAAMLSERAGRTFDLAFQRELKFIIKLRVGEALRQTLNKTPLDRKFLFEKFNFELEKVSILKCRDYGCQLRTIDKIPRPLRANNILFDFVGTGDFKSAFTYRLESQLEFFNHSELTSFFPSFIYADGYIYISNPPTVEFKTLGAQYIPEDYIEAMKFKCLEDCVTDDDPLPVGYDVISTVVNMIYDKDLRGNNNDIKQETVNVDNK